MHGVMNWKGTPPKIQKILLCLVFTPVAHTFVKKTWKVQPRCQVHKHFSSGSQLGARSGLRIVFFLSPLPPVMVSPTDQ